MTNTYTPEPVYKEFSFKDDDPEFQDSYWDDVYSVLKVSQDRGLPSSDSTAINFAFVVNAHEPNNAFTIYSAEIDRYIEVFNWMKSQLVQETPEDDAIEGPDELDS